MASQATGFLLEKVGMSCKGLNKEGESLLGRSGRGPIFLAKIYPGNTQSINFWYKVS